VGAASVVEVEADDSVGFHVFQETAQLQLEEPITMRADSAFEKA
jgi:hypothetical protein